MPQAAPDRAARFKRHVRRSDYWLGTTRSTRPSALSVSRYSAPSGPPRTSRMRSPSSSNNTSCPASLPSCRRIRRTLRSARVEANRSPCHCGNSAPRYERQARRRHRGRPVQQRLLQARQLGVGRNLRTGVVNAVGDQRPAIVDCPASIRFSSSPPRGPCSWLYRRLKLVVIDDALHIAMAQL